MRARIFIESSNLNIGLMCFIVVGIGKVSTCEITVHEHQQMQKGDQLNIFRLGALTYCLVFRPGVDLDWDDHPIRSEVETSIVKVNTQIARVKLKASKKRHSCQAVEPDGSIKGYLLIM